MASRAWRGVRARRAGGPARAFARDEDGAVVTVEFMLWIPFFALIWAVTTDAALLFVTNASMWNVARDTARRMSVNDPPEIGYVENARRNLLFDNAYEVSARQVGGDVDVTIRASVADAGLFGVFNGVEEIKARVVMRREY